MKLFVNSWENTALMVIDVQFGLFIGKTPIYNSEELLNNFNLLIDSARVNNISSIFIQHPTEGIVELIKAEEVKL